MYTEENTKDATLFRFNQLEWPVFYRKEGDLYFIISHIDGTRQPIGVPEDVNSLIELSRPQSDIEALFEGAPDWATGYAWLNIGLDRVYYWVDDEGFMCLEMSCATKFRNYGGEHASKSDFTIIATRPEPKSEQSNTQGFHTNGQDFDPVSVKPVFTQKMYGTLPPIGSEYFCEDDQLCVSLAHIGEYVIGEAVGYVQIDGRPSISVSNLEDVSVDTRTDKQKACDAICKEIDEIPGPYCLKVAMELAYDRWVGK